MWKERQVSNWEVCCSRFWLSSSLAPNLRISRSSLLDTFSKFYDNCSPTSRGSRLLASPHSVTLHPSNLSSQLPSPLSLTTKMDWIKADIDSKKRSLSSDTSTSSKYIKRGDLEKIRVTQAKLDAENETRERELRAVALREGREKGKGKAVSALIEAESAVDSISSGGEESEGTPVPVAIGEKVEGFNVSNPEAVRRLRNKGQPIRLFGESDKERRLRLRALELIEERTEGQRNEFAIALDGMEKGLDMDAMSAAQAGGSKNMTEGEKKEAEAKSDRAKKMREENVQVDLSLVKDNAHKVYPQIYHALKVLCIVVLIRGKLADLELACSVS